MVRTHTLATNLLLGLIAMAPSCVSETKSSPDYGDLSARQAKPKGCWQVWQGAQLAGYVVRFEEPGQGGSMLLSVRNSHNQDLGWIDQVGRAWRYRPHEDPEWMSSGSTLQGVRQILKLGEDARMLSCPLSDLPPGK